MSIVTVGIDLAKNVLAVHGVNEAGRAELVRSPVPGEKLHELIASLPSCVIGMEACSGGPGTCVPSKADWGKAVCSVLVHRDAGSPEPVTPGRDQQEKKMRA